MKRSGIAAAISAILVLISMRHEPHRSRRTWLLGDQVREKRGRSITYQYNRAESKGETSFVTDVFELTGHTSTVEVKTFATVSNHWIYLNYALINQDSGQAWDFGREVSYYSGYDSDGSWTEGKQNDAVVIPSVPPGHYYLRIEPEADPSLPSIPYTVDVTRDVPVFGIYGIAFLALLVPVVIISFRAYTFERSRWSESDHPPMQLSSMSSSSGDDE